MAIGRITKLQTDDEKLNRVQDGLVAALNPALAKLQEVTARPAVTGAKGGNAALESLISALASLGLIEDRTS